MSLEVLRHRSEVRRARVALKARGVSLAHGWFVRTARRFARRLGIRSAPGVGDVRKSWDILRTTAFIEQHVGRHETVLDIGARGSEMLPILHRLGYQHLIGIDLAAAVLKMPSADRIDYRVGDFMRTGLGARSCAAVTAISVIEHGYDADGLFQEVSRLLRPGGYFIASFDYWPKKLSTDGTTLFGMSWRIFSADEVRQLILDAGRWGLEPCGALNMDAKVPIVHFEGRDYTFAWLALRKP